MLKLRGTRILIDKPVKENKVELELSAKDKEMIEADDIKTWFKLKVFAVGPDVVDVKEGDEIYVHADARMEKTEVFGTEDKNIKYIIREQDVAWIWENTEKNQ